MSNLEWDVYMAILRDKSDDPSVWARNKLQQMADRIHALTAERDEARRELERLYDEKFRGNGALDLLADLDKECGL